MYSKNGGTVDLEARLDASMVRKQRAKSEIQADGIS